MAKYETYIPTDTAVTLKEMAETLVFNGGTGIDTVNPVGSTLFEPDANVRWGSCRKPIRKTDTTLDRNTEWWKTPDGLCGMSVPSVGGGAINSIPSLSGYYDGAMNGWEYLLPRGTTSSYVEPLRWADFRGYYAIATPIVRGYSCPTSVTNVGSTTPYVMMSLPIGEEGKQLQWKDFDRFKDCFFGVLIKGASDAIFQTASNTLGTGGVEIALQPNRLMEGSYTVYPVVSTVASSTPTKDDVQGTFYTIPYASVTEMTVTGLQLSIEVFGRKESGGTAKMWFRVTNSSSRSQTLSGNYVYLRYKDKDVGDILDANEVSRSIPTLTVAAYSTLTYTYETNSNLIFSNIPTLLFNNCKVWVTLSNGTYKNGVEPLYDINIGDK